MNRKNIKILYLSDKNLTIHHREIFNNFNKIYTLKGYGPGFPNYNNNDRIEDVFRKTFRPDVLIFGTGWADFEKVRPTYHPNINVAHITDIPKALIIGKPYKYMTAKKQFIVDNKLDVVFTQAFCHKEWEEEIGVRFERIHYGADETVFKDYGVDKIYDIGFTGNLHDTNKYKTDGEKKGLSKEWLYPDLMGPGFNNIRVKAINELKKPEYDDYKKYIPIKGAIGESIKTKEFQGVEYAQLIGKSKIWICTTSSMKTVTPRCFETMACGTLVFCNECDSYEGIIEPGVNCITFKDDLSDLKEKIDYYLNNGDELKKITQNAYTYFINNCTWSHRVNQMVDILLTYKK